MSYSDIFNGPPKNGDSDNLLLIKIWSRLQAVVGALGGGTGAEGVSGLPYGADEQDITNVAAGPSVIVYKRNGGVVKTRTFTYTNGGASSTDVLTKTVDT